MANDKLYSETDIEDIANSIRGKNGTTTKYKVSQMAAAIDNLPSGGAVESVDGQTGVVVTNAVKTIPQTLTDTQKTQVQTNIGVIDTVQNLSSILSGNTIVPKASMAQSDTAGNNISQTFAGIINGSTVVGEANKATYDSADNEISTTYASITELNQKADNSQYAVNAINTLNGNSFTINLSSPSLAIPNSSLEITPSMSLLPKKSSDGTYLSNCSLGDSLRWWNTVYAGTVYVRDFGNASYNQVASYKGPTADALGTTAPIGTIRKKTNSDGTQHLGYYIKTSASESEWDSLAGQDYLITSYTDTDGGRNITIRKYNSGIMIQNYRVNVGTVSRESWQPWNNSLYYYQYGTLTFSESFVDFPSVTATVSSTNGALMFGGGRVTKTSYYAIMAISALAKENSGVEFNFHVIGRWK